MPSYYPPAGKKSVQANGIKLTQKGMSFDQPRADFELLVKEGLLSHTPSEVQDDANEEQSQTGGDAFAEIERLADEAEASRDQTGATDLTSSAPADTKSALGGAPTPEDLNPPPADLSAGGPSGEENNASDNQSDVETNAGPQEGSDPATKNDQPNTPIAGSTGPHTEESLAAMHHATVKSMATAIDANFVGGKTDAIKVILDNQK